MTSTSSTGTSSPATPAVHGVTASIGSPSSAVNAVSATIGDLSSRVAEAAFRTGSTPSTNGFSATFSPSPSSSVAGATATFSPGPNLAITAEQPANLAIQAQRVERAAIGRIYLSTHSHGTSLQKGTNTEQSERIKELYSSVADTLVEEGIIVEEDISSLTIFYDRGAISYRDEDGNTIEKSILADMESSSILSEKMEELAAYGHQVQGILHRPHALSSKIKGTRHGSHSLRRSSSEEAYKQRKTALENAKGEIRKCRAAIANPTTDKKTLPQIKQKLSEFKSRLPALEAEVATFTLQERLPRTLAQAAPLAKENLPPSIDEARFTKRVTSTSAHLDALRKVLDKQYATKDEAYKKAVEATTPPTPPAQLTQMKKELSAIRALQHKAAEIDEYALTMALAYCPTQGATDTEFHNAAEDLKTAIDTHYQEAFRQHQHERMQRSWGQFFKDGFGLYNHLSPMDEYQADYATDAAGLLYSAADAEEQGRAGRLYHTYCIDHSISLKAANFTDEILAQMIKLERDANYNVADALNNYFKGLAEDDRQAIADAIRAVNHS